MVGIIQEQHPERARLFMQWKKMGWPVMVDSLNLLDVSVVPITLLIDGQGIVRQRVRGRADPREVVKAFLAEAEASKPTAKVTPRMPNLRATREGLNEQSATEWRAYAEALASWGKRPASLDQAIAAFGSALKLDPEDGRAAFRLGVAYRMRYDSPGGDVLDFGRAVQSWTRAREIDPNNYIWMRRLQQYGPRLAKPYPFYDWVDAAGREIAARGETPVALPVAPRGAELTAPLERFEVAPTAEEPDREGRIHRDPGKFVRVEMLTVPLQVTAGKSARVHLEFRPNKASDAHWNNEVGAMTLWFDAPKGWTLDRRKESLGYPPVAVSDEPRRVELEVKSPADARSTHLHAYALYYVCEGINGQCLYRRQDLRVPLKVVPAANP